ncbi:MAG: polysaccharide biosynthesis/export family protein [Armatimonadetes bacterium]|nr:polysaccharide biosynthesis/export family protein [Armatimonadota bacterium]
MKLIWVLLAVMIAALGFSQSTASVQSDLYTLQPEDVIRIQVYNDQQIAVEVPVGPDGFVSAPFVGMIKASGKTTGELEKELTQRYIDKLRLRNPRVSVIIVKFREILASVGGAVNAPGTYPMRPGETLVSLLNKGRGYIRDGSDLRRATLRKKGSAELIPVDLHALLVRGDTTQDYVIEDGDELTVPEDNRNIINIMGIVSRPGQYPYREPMTVGDAVAMAGADSTGRARFSKIKIFRELPGGQVQTINVDLTRYLGKGDYTQNILLQPRDFIFVPETNTPNISQLGNIATSLLFFQDVLRRGLFGLRIF